ncbi:hypothetical protein [Mycobacterium bourgelatii]|uniref:Uncharacterized protein n=1 Tax=Mycobacterium bourgelatii TaxID=1273442 RepID=A0A7I9YSM9_MYCBU|nr:hypothetical protein [Mycobacterium bourgelatii]GFG91688.1 hypothetical protein MBOU_37300 [Mycobacterium bourgelatii]
MLLPLGPPLPPDAVAAKRGESGMLGGLSVPLSWGVAVPPDDYDHWAKDAKDGAEPELVPGAVDTESAVAAAEEELWDEWAAWREWQAENAEPRFEMPRNNNVVPHSPAAG